MYCAALDLQNLLVWPCMALKHLGIHKSKISSRSLCLKLNLWKFHVNFPANLPTKEFMNRTVLDYFCLVLWDAVYKTHHSVFIFLVGFVFDTRNYVFIFVRFCMWLFLWDSVLNTYHSVLTQGQPSDLLHQVLG